MTSTKAKLEFVYAMAKHSNASIRDLEALMRYGATLNRLATHHCNGDCPYPHDYDGTGRDCPKQERIMRKVADLLLTWQSVNHKAAVPVFQNDPRGCTLKIAVPDGYTNDWGREGICVPTS